MIPLRSLIFGAFLSIVAVVAMLPVYFAAMANLDHVISYEEMRRHYRDAFKTGVLSDEVHPSNHLFTSGDRFTDCIALSVGMQPGISPLTAGILAPVPASDRHPCEDLRSIAEGQASAMQWGQYLRYWHGYRVYYAPLASLLPIYAVKLFNLLLLLGAFAAFCWQSARLIGAAPTVGLAVPVLFLTDFARVWQVTPHAIGVIFILAGAACFISGIQRRFPDYALVALAAVFGSIFNFIDFLVNPPWMPMLLAFFVVSGMRGRTRWLSTTAMFVALAWFGGYALTWFSKWLIAYFVSTEVDVVANVSAMVLFRLDGDNAKVVHWLFAPTFKVIVAVISSWGLPFFIAFLAIFIQNIRAGSFRWQAFWPLAWPALIPALWFEILSNHTQIHARVSSRSEAAAFGVLIAAALLASGVKSLSLSWSSGQAIRLLPRSPPDKPGRAGATSPTVLGAAPRPVARQGLGS